jgi:hypothetical protein
MTPFPKVGIQSVFETDAFNKGLSDYKRGLNEASNKTSDAARKITESAPSGNIFSKALGGLSRGLLDIGKIAAGFVFGNLIQDGLRAATQLIPDMIGKASDLSETINKTKVVFGDAGDAILQFAETADTQLGQSKQAALDAASTFGIFGKAAGLTGDDLSSFSTDLVGLASDIASFNNASPEEVVVALGAALRGESEPMRRFGVLLNEAVLQEKALELGIISTTNEALTPQQKILAANAVIWEQTADAQGYFARTSGGLANQQRILTAQMENLKATLGNALLPVITQFITAITQFVQTDEFKAWLDAAVAGLMQFGVWLGENLPVALATAQEWFEAIQPTLAAVYTWLAENLPIAIQALSAFWTGTLQPALQAVWQFLQANVIPILQQVWDWLSVNLPPAIQALADFWSNVLQPALQRVWQFLTVDMLPVWEALGDFLGVAIPLAIKAVQGAWQNILKPVLDAIWKFLDTYIIPVFQAWWESIGGLRGAIEAVVGWIRNMTDALRNVQLPDWLTPGSPTPFETGLRGIADALSEINRMGLPAFMTGGMSAPNMSGKRYNQVSPGGVIPRYQPAMAAQPIATSVTNTSNINLGGVNIHGVASWAEFEAMLNRVIARSR